MVERYLWGQCRHAGPPVLPGASALRRLGEGVASLPRAVLARVPERGSGGGGEGVASPPEPALPGAAWAEGRDRCAVPPAAPCCTRGAACWAAPQGLSGPVLSGGKTLVASHCRCMWAPRVWRTTIVRVCCRHPSLQTAPSCGAPGSLQGGSMRGSAPSHATPDLAPVNELAASQTEPAPAAFSTPPVSGDVPLRQRFGDSLPGHEQAVAGHIPPGAAPR